MNTATKTNRVTETEAYSVLRLAQLHETEGSMVSSAKLCADEAVAEFNVGNFDNCARRAKDSLRYSVGLFHKDCQTALEMARKAGGS